MSDVDTTTGLEEAVAHVAISPAKAALATSDIATKETILEEVSEVKDEVDAHGSNTVAETTAETAISTETVTVSISAAAEAIVSTVEDGESALVADMKKLKQAIANEGLSAVVEPPQNSAEGTTSPNTKRKKNQKNAKKDGEHVDSATTTPAKVNKESVAELPSPEEQHMAAKQQKTPKQKADRETDVTKVVETEKPVDKAPASALKNDDSVEEGDKKKKLGSRQRRALRDERLAAEAAAAGTTGTPSPNTVAQAATPVPAAKTETTKPVGASDSAAVDGQSKPKRQRNKKSLAEGDAVSAETPATVETVAVPGKKPTKQTASIPASAVAPVPVSAPASAPETEESAEKRKQLTSTERRARRDAGRLAAAEAERANATPATATPVITNTAPAEVALAADAGAAKKGRNAKKQEPEAAQAAVTAPAPTPAVSKQAPQQTPKLAQTTKTTTAASAPAAAPAQATASAAAALVTAAAATKVVPTAANLPGLKPDQRIVVHSAVTILLQTLRNGDSLVYTQHGALKTHLLTELAQLGYVGIEGNAAAHQKIVFLPQGLSYSDPIKNSPDFPALKPRGDVKIEQPGLCLQVKCYPAFGAESPKMAGLKAFKSGFLRHFDEVAQAETDVYLFVLSAEVYHEFALKAASTLPELSAIQHFASTHRIAYVTKKEVSCKLNSVLCKIDAGYGEFVVGAIHA